jgi:hypothetical protein
MTFPMLQAHAAWDSDERWLRYTFAHLAALVDKTGEAQPLIDSKARVPAEAVAPFVAASLDHALNQLYRALKCDRDGLSEACRLEAAQGVTPFIDALFAVNGGRLRPYYKYLRWELTEHPLSSSPFDAEALIQRLAAVVAPGGAFALQELMVATAALFRAAGYGSTYDGWGGALDFMLSYRARRTAAGTYEVEHQVKPLLPEPAERRLGLAEALVDILQPALEHRLLAQQELELPGRIHPLGVLAPLHHHPGLADQILGLGEREHDLVADVVEGHVHNTPSEGRSFSLLPQER